MKTRVLRGDNPSGRFRLLCKLSGLPMPVVEYTFHPSRRWRWDYAWPEEKVALEVDGGNFVRGAHVRGARILKTHEKLNAAAALGWRVLYTVPRQLHTTALIDVLRVALSHLICKT